MGNRTGKREDPCLNCSQKLILLATLCAMHTQTVEITIFTNDLLDSGAVGNVLFDSDRTCARNTCNMYLIRTIVHSLGIIKNNVVQ